LAKNLKLNIKNTQLAEALKLTKVKKPAGAASKKKIAEVEAPSAVEEKVVVAAPPAPEPVTPPAPLPEPMAAAPTPRFEKPFPRVEKMEEPAERPSAPAPSQFRNPPERDSEERSGHGGYNRPPQQGGYNRPSGQSGYGNRPPGQGGYQSRPQESRPSGQAPGTYEDRRPRPLYTATPQYRPPYQQGSRPPGQGGYPPRAPYQPGSRPPGPRRDFGPGAPRPFTPGGPRRDFSSPMPRPAIPPKDISGADGEKRLQRDIRTAEPPKKAGFKDFKDVKTTKKVEPNRSFDSRDRQGLRDTDNEEWRKRRSAKTRVQIQEEVIRPKSLKVRLPITLKDLASEMKLKSSQLISKLFMQGVVMTLNDFFDDETTVQLLGHEFECEITIDTSQEERLRITEKTIKQEVSESDPSDLILRPPVIAFMGHVDHGKTSLIDAIRKSNRVAGEAGAITQHIGAFKCHTAVGDIAILDTPGHEAFSAMRERGAEVTDIVVLVIAGDEGIRAQTLEAIKQAQDAKVPIVVALNKSDKPNFNAENIYRQLADNNLLPEAWGGTVITVNCSAVTGAGIKELLEMLALQAEVLELKANPKSRARGTVIESELHKGMGSVATLLVQNGTLRIGDALVFGYHWARVKTMQDEYNREVKEAGPSTPVKITGLSSLPEAGSEFIVVKDEKEARELAYERTAGHKSTLLQQTKRGSVEGLLQKNADQKVKKTLTLILRGDVQGSVEALKNSLLKIPSSKVDLNIISAGVGEVSESDIQLAAASKATIIGFHTAVESHAESLIKQTKVVVKLHDVIYHAVDDVKELMLQLLDKIAQENDTGTALVKAVFRSSQLGLIAGCQVTDGNIKRNNHVRLMRGDKMIWKGAISSLKRGKEDVREVSKGIECGILLHNFSEVKEGDILQAYEITYLQQELT
jgi:translation initiation factor IF-2